MSARSFSKKKVKPVRPTNPTQPVSARPKGRPDVYTVMTILAFMGILAGTVLMYLESAKFAG